MQMSKEVKNTASQWVLEAELKQQMIKENMTLLQLIFVITVSISRIGTVGFINVYNK